MVAAQVEVFLSYSRNDSAICRWIAAGLATAGCTVWRDEAAVKAGDTWVRSIFRGIESADFIVPLLSASALASPWVRKEIDTALLRTLGRGSSQCIVPVRIEPVEPPLELRSLQCIDFFADNAHGVCALIDRVRMPRRIESRPDAPGVGSQEIGRA